VVVPAAIGTGWIGVELTANDKLPDGPAIGVDESGEQGEVELSDGQASECKQQHESPHAARELSSNICRIAEHLAPQAYGELAGIVENNCWLNNCWLRHVL